MKNTLLVLVIFVMACASCSNIKNQMPNNDDNSNWHYFGLDKPGNTPQLFSPGIVSTQRNERDFTISPDGKEMFYTLVLPAKNLHVILNLRFDGFFWSEPQVSSFSGAYNDLEPAYSADGKKLFFVSDRPLTENDTISDFNIWFLENMGYGWSKPTSVGEAINSEMDEYYPSVSNNGTLYFTAKYEDSFGQEDIYYSTFIDGSYTKPINLGESINSNLLEFNAYISPAEDYLIFSSYERDDGIGKGDLYISFKENTGQWGKALNMGEEINSPQLDYCPFITSDGDYLFFTSEREDIRFNNLKKKSIKQVFQYANGIQNRLGNIYWVNFDSIAIINN